MQTNQLKPAAADDEVEKMVEERLAAADDEVGKMVEERLAAAKLEIAGLDAGGTNTATARHPSRTDYGFHPISLSIRVLSEATRARRRSCSSGDCSRRGHRPCTARR
jgi:hypothetical protein